MDSQRSCFDRVYDLFYEYIRFPYVPLVDRLWQSAASVSRQSDGASGAPASLLSTANFTPFVCRFCGSAATRWVERPQIAEKEPAAERASDGDAGSVKRAKRGAKCAKRGAKCARGRLLLPG